MEKLKIAVLFGGVSSEHEISLKSATYILNNLSRIKFEVFPIGISKQGNWFFYSGSIDDVATGKWILNENACKRVVFSSDSNFKGFLRFEGESRFLLMKVDCIFLTLHGRNGEDGRLQGFFEAANMPFVGCGSISSANCMDKEMTHIILEHAGIKMAKFKSIKSTNLNQLDKFCLEVKKSLNLPIFVKPANAGSSIGISKCSDFSELNDAILKAFEIDSKVICEEGIENCKEVECAVLGNSSPNTADYLGEIKAGNDFYDYDSKYEIDSQLIIPANLSSECSKQVKKIAIEAFSAMGCRGLARVDFLIGEGDDVILNEINTLPGFTKISMYPKLWEKSGLNGSALLSNLIDLALES